MPLLFTRDKKFYRTIFSLMFLLVLQNVISFGVNLTDNILLGGYSQAALSGAATVNQLQFILQQLTMGIGEGLVVLGAQYWGQKKTDPVKQIVSIAFWCGILIGIALTLAVSFEPRAILSLFTTDDAILDQGVEYLYLMRFTYLLFIITNILLAGLRSVQTVKIAFYISISTFIINGLINYTLIFGHFGAPRLGIRGASIGTLTARCIELVIVVTYLCLHDRKLRLKLKDFLVIDPAMLRDFLRICMPVVVTYGLWGIATGLQTVILGHMDSNAIAANSVSTTFFQVLKTVSVGASSASAVVIGMTVGSGRIDKVREYTKTLQMLYLLIGVLTSAALFFLRGPLLQFYTLTPDAKALANSFLLVLCVTCIGTAYEMPALGGIIRGGGDTKFVLINDMISIWGIVLPTSFLGAFYFHLPTVAIVALLNSDQIFKCGVAVIKVNRYRWIKKLTRDTPQPA